MRVLHLTCLLHKNNKKLSRRGQKGQDKGPERQQRVKVVKRHRRLFTVGASEVFPACFASCVDATAPPPQNGPQP